MITCKSFLPLRKGWKASWRGGWAYLRGGLIEDDGNCSIGPCTSKQTSPLNTVKQTLKIVP